MSMQLRPSSHAGSLCSSWSRRSARSSTSFQSAASVVPLPLEDGESGSVTFWINVLQDDLPIVKGTAEFLTMFGTVVSASTSLKERLLDRDRFLAWLRACTREYLEEHDEGQAVIEAARARTAPRQLAMWSDKRQGMQIRGMCSLDFSRALKEDGEFSDCAPVALVLRDCRTYKVKSSKQRRSAGPATGGEQPSTEIVSSEKSMLECL